MKLRMRTHSGLLGCLGVAFLLAASCGGKVEGEVDDDFVFFDYVVPAGTSGAFSFDSTTETERDVSGYHATLMAMTLETTRPGQNLAFLDDLEGFAKKGDRPRFASQSEFGPVTRVSLELHYKGDIQPYFSDGHHVVVSWSGHVKGVVPAGGIAIRCKVGLKY